MNYDPQDFKSVILYMRNEFGASVFRDAPRMYAIFCDLSPKLKAYGNVMRQLIERGTLAELDAASGDETRQARAMMKSRDILENELLLGAERVEVFLDTLGALYSVIPPTPQPVPEVKRTPVLIQQEQPKPILQPPPQPVPLSANIIQHGKCGWRVEYELDKKGVLKISGQNFMWNFDFHGYNGVDTPWWVERNTITLVQIQNSVTNIGNHAFCTCERLTHVTISDSVTEIGEGAFRDCTALPSVVIPDSVTKIGDGAFYGCTGLTSVAIPNSVTKIGDWAFWGCAKLTSVAIPDNVTKIGHGTFYGCAELASVGIPDSVTEIGDYAFNGCKGLTSVAIPHGVTEIRVDAFRGCAGLTSVAISGSVTSIGDYAFYGCTGLTSVAIPNSVTKIGDWAFWGCKNLKSVSVPEKAEIGNWAFPDTVHVERRA